MASISARTSSLKATPAASMSSFNWAIAKISFGAALGLLLRRDGTHFRRVDEVDAARDCAIELLVRIALAVLLSPCHRAEADFRYPKAPRSKLVVFHCLLSNCNYMSRGLPAIPAD